METNASAFSLDRKVTPELLENVVLQSIERLLEKDNPALETMKMQVTNMAQPKSFCLLMLYT